MESNNEENRSIDQLLREGYPPELPYGFAERVATIAMAGVARAQPTLWDLLAMISPRTTLALGAVTILLIVAGVADLGIGQAALSDPSPELGELIVMP